MRYIVINAIINLIGILKLIIIINALLSWIPSLRGNAVVNLLNYIVEPILAPIRWMIQKSSLGRNMMFDISPIIAILLLELIGSIIKDFLY